MNFTDKNGKAWPIKLVFGHYEQIKEDFGIDLESFISSEKEFAKLFELKPGQLVGITYIICKEEIEKAQLSPKDWAMLFGGEQIESAAMSLADSVLSFFPRSKISRAMRENLHKIMAKMDEKVIEKINKNLETKLDSILETSVGHVQESSESIHVPSPIAN